MYSLHYKSISAKRPKATHLLVRFCGWDFPNPCRLQCTESAVLHHPFRFLCHCWAPSLQESILSPTDPLWFLPSPHRNHRLPPHLPHPSLMLPTLCSSHTREGSCLYPPSKIPATASTFPGQVCQGGMPFTLLSTLNRSKLRCLETFVFSCCTNSGFSAKEAGFAIWPYAWDPPHLLLHLWSDPWSFK